MSLGWRLWTLEAILNQSLTVVYVDESQFTLLKFYTTEKIYFNANTCSKTFAIKILFRKILFILRICWISFFQSDT